MLPSAIANTGWKIYILFILCTALSIPFVYFCLPEVSWSKLAISGTADISGSDYG